MASWVSITEEQTAGTDLVGHKPLGLSDVKFLKGPSIILKEVVGENKDTNL